MIRKFFLIFVGMLLLCGLASATEYFVSPDGTGDGLSVDAPGDPSVLDTSLRAGDTMYFMGGLYQDKPIFISVAGNATHPIVFTNYPGEYPILNGSYPTTTDYNGIRLLNGKYINVNNLTFLNYNNGVYSRYDASSTNCAVGIHVYNCTFRNCYSSAVTFNNYAQHSSVRNCTIENVRWNTIGICGSNENKSNPVKYTHDILIENCTILPPYKHSSIDLFGGLENITIKNNTIIGDNIEFGNIFSHPTDGWTTLAENVTIDGNYLTKIPANAIYIEANNSIYKNNIIHNCTGGGFYTNQNVNNLTLYNNTVYDNVFSGMEIHGVNVVYDSNIVYNITGASSRDYKSISNGLIIRNAVYTPGKLRSYISAKTTSVDSIFEYPNGRVFTTSGVTSYTPTGSTYTISNADEQFIVYNYSALPESETATVIPNTLSGSELVNFTAESTNGNLVTFNAWGLTSGAQYRIKEDGVEKSTQLANETGMISWTNSAWSEHVYTVEATGLRLPVCAFTANATDGTAPKTIQFTDASTQSPETWSWDFNGDDVEDSTEQNPVWTYDTDGSYDVSLTVTNAIGSDTETKTDYIKLTNPYVAPIILTTVAAALLFMRARRRW